MAGLASDFGVPVSIHAPRMRGDKGARVVDVSNSNVSIHAPRMRGDVAVAV